MYCEQASLASESHNFVTANVLINSRHNRPTLVRNNSDNESRSFELQNFDGKYEISQYNYFYSSIE